MSTPDEKNTNKDELDELVESWEKYVLSEEDYEPAEEKKEPVKEEVIPKRKKKSPLIPITVILILLAVFSVSAVVIMKKGGFERFKAADGVSGTQSVSESTAENHTFYASYEEEKGSSTEAVSSTEEASSEKEESSSEASEESSETSKENDKESTKKETTKKVSEIETTKPQKVEKATYVKGILVVNKSYALPSDYAPGVNSEAKKAFNAMAADAADEGINLWIRSGYRSYDTQKNIYNNYVAQDGKAEADRYSARPGHSEHQTGLAFDVNSLSQSFENEPEGKWLAQNCWKYGFIIRYPKGKESITGYMYEPWHIRYLGTDTAKKVHDSGLTLEEYLGIDSKYKD